MNSSTISFIAWAVLMLIVLVALVVAARKSKGLQNETEDIASRALPEIGGIAEREHHKRFGRAPTGAPGSSNGETSWYPEAKRKVAKRA